MPTPIPDSVALASARDADPFARAQVAAAAYLARYSGRTLEPYRYDLRANGGIPHGISSNIHGESDSNSLRRGGFDEEGKEGRS
jgi:hypothetical protein